MENTSPEASLCGTARRIISRSISKPGHSSIGPRVGEPPGVGVDSDGVDLEVGAVPEEDLGVALGMSAMPEEDAEVGAVPEEDLGVAAGMSAVP